MKTPIFIILTCLTFNLFAQDRVTVSSEEITTPNVSIVYVIGDDLTNTTTDSNLIITEGFQQFFLSEDMTLSTNEELTENSISVFPNPTAKTINIKLEAFTGYEYVLYNTSGAFIKKASIKVQDTAVDISSYESGIYYLKLLNTKTKETQVIKIIKK